MSLNNEQFEFSRKVALLILFAYEIGYTIQLGDAKAKTGHIDNSFHYKSLAIDLNLFKDGIYLTKTSDHLPLGKFWKCLGGTWGGDWRDGNHYSWGE